MTSLPLILPENCQLKVSVEDKVTEGQIIAQKKQNNLTRVLPIAKYLEISPEKTLKALNKKIGDRVEEGDLLAEKKGVMNGKKLFSPFSGTVYKLEEESGDLYIVTDQGDSGEAEDIISPIEGKISFCDNTKIVIDTDKKGIIGLKASGEKAEGELFVIHEKDIDYSDLPKEIKEKVILGEGFESSAIYKAIAMGVIGIICQEIQEDQLEEYRKKQYKNPIIQVSKEDFEKLSKLSGKKIILEPSKKIILI
jgi:hypothetical protein